MGFARGRQEGFGYKSVVLDLKPGLVCHRETALCGVAGYVVYDGKKAVASASNSNEAWFKALVRIRKKRDRKKNR